MPTIKKSVALYVTLLMTVFFFASAHGVFTQDKSGLDDSATVQEQPQPSAVKITINKEISDELVVFVGDCDEVKSDRQALKAAVQKKDNAAIERVRTKLHQDIAKCYHRDRAALEEGSSKRKRGDEKNAKETRVLRRGSSETDAKSN